MTLTTGGARVAKDDDDPTIVLIWATRAHAMAIKAGWPEKPFAERLGQSIADETVRKRLGPLRGRKRPGDPDPRSSELAERLKFWLGVKWDWPQAFARYRRRMPYDPRRHNTMACDYGVTVELAEADVWRLILPAVPAGLHAGEAADGAALAGTVQSVATLVTSEAGDSTALAAIISDRWATLATSEAADAAADAAALTETTSGDTAQRN